MTADPEFWPAVARHLTAQREAAQREDRLRHRISHRGYHLQKRRGADCYLIRDANDQAVAGLGQGLTLDQVEEWVRGPPRSRAGLTTTRPRASPRCGQRCSST